MRENILTKITKGNLPAFKSFSLSDKSNFYLTSYDDILKLLKKIIQTNNTFIGTLNFVGDTNLKLSDLGKKDLKYGTYIYNSGNISNEKFKKNFKFKLQSNKYILNAIKKKFK